MASPSAQGSELEWWQLSQQEIIDLTRDDDDDDDDEGFATGVGPQHATAANLEGGMTVTPRLTVPTFGQQHMSQYVAGSKRKRSQQDQGVDFHIVKEAQDATADRVKWIDDMHVRYPCPPLPKLHHTAMDDDVVLLDEHSSKVPRAVVRIEGVPYLLEPGVIVKLKTGGYAIFACAEKVSLRIWKVQVHRLVTFQDTVLGSSKKTTTTPKAARNAGRVEIFVAMRADNLHLDELRKLDDFKEPYNYFGGYPMVRFAYNHDKGDFQNLPDYLPWHDRQGAGAGRSGNLKFVDVCCGGGGLSVGMSQAGMVPLAGVDVDADAINTYQHNMLKIFNTKATVFHNSMDDYNKLLHDPFSNKKLIKIGSNSERLRRLFELKADAEALVGGIPCQGLSTANPRNFADADAETRDVRNMLYNDFASLLDANHLPRLRFALVEEVPGFAELAPELFRVAVEMGFQVKLRLMNALHFGCAQNRLRLFVVMARLGEEMPVDPTPTHRSWKGESTPTHMGWFAKKSIAIKPGPSSSGSAKPCVTLEDAIGDLKNLEVTPGQHVCAKVADQRGTMPCHNAKKLGDDDCARWHALQPGQCAKDLPEGLKPSDKGAKRRADGGKWHEIGRKYGKPQWNEPSATVLTRCDPSHGPYFHPSQCRTFSTRERMRLFEFPNEYNVSSTYTLGPPADKIDTENRIVGNSVPPPLGRAWGESIVAAAVAKTP
ncbi:DNA (cytosine-5)-methyltransferase 1 [Pycnococcus provasolii]